MREAKPRTLWIPFDELASLANGMTKFICFRYFMLDTGFDSMITVDT
jgi:hypothetical protein